MSHSLLNSERRGRGGWRLPSDNWPKPALSQRSSRRLRCFVLGIRWIAPRVSGRSRSKTYGKGYDSFVMRHRSDFPKKGSLRESCGAEQRIFKELRVIFFRLETLFSGKSSRRTLAGSLPLSHKCSTKSFLV